MIIPSPLRKGECVGVTAPSFGVVEPLDIKRFEHAEEILNGKGYRVKKTSNVHTADETGRSSPMMQRVTEFYDLLMDPSVGCIISASGGDYQCEMLMGMDWDLLERYPKWVQGYSDNTVLLFKITAEHDIATIYGGNFGDFGMEPWHRSIAEHLEFLERRRDSQESFDAYQDGFSERVTGLEPFREDLPARWVSDGDVKFKGRLIGGCMDVLEWYQKKGLVHLDGFNSKYAEEGIVWYMETFDMDDARIGKMFAGMIKDGWFKGVKGFVFGRPLFYKGDDYQRVVRECLKDFDVPIVFDADVGHKGPRMTFINGAVAEFDIKDGRCTLRYELPR